MINIDCKAFTRMMNSRMMDNPSKLINRSQSEFITALPVNKFGICLYIKFNVRQFRNYVGSNKRLWSYSSQIIMQNTNRFGLPDKFIKCIQDLFFGKSISVNVNKLCQRESISSILFQFCNKTILTIYS